MLDNLVHLFIPHHSNNHKPKVLHHGSLLILISLFVSAQALLTLSQLIYPNVLGFASQIPPTTIIELTNQKRQQAGLSVVTHNEKLSDAARRKAVDMFNKDYWSHNAPDGTKPWSFIIAAGYNYLHAGENLARDFNNPNSVVDAWMASPTHRDNLLNSRYQEIGIAVVDGQLGGVETTLVVQMFGTPQSFNPSTSAVSGSTTIVPPAQAKEPEPVVVVEEIVKTPNEEIIPTPTPTQDRSLNQPVLNTFSLSKVISFSFLILIFSILLIDWFIAWDRNIIRLSGRNWAHLAFLGTILALGFIIKQGLIL